MPFMRAVAGLDEEDPLSRDVELGDPAAVQLDGLDVVLSDSASLKPVHRDVYAARERAAGALAAAGARVRREHLKGMRRAVEFYLATLRDGAGDELSEIFGLDAAPRLRHMAFAVRRTGDHTVATGLLFAADRLADRIPDGVTRRSISAGRALAREVDEVIGDGVLLHPPFPRTAPATA
jgi:fatty acid amide hydrolase 2